MTQVCSFPPSTADVNDKYYDKRLPKGIHIIGADEESVPRVGGISKNVEENNQTEQKLPWGYIFIQHMSAESFEKKLKTRKIEGDFKPKCFIHRTIRYKQKQNGSGIIKEERPSVSGLVFLQGRTEQLKSFLIHNFPQYFLVNDCCTGKPAVISDSKMRPFMKIMKDEPGRVTFLRDPFIKFAKGHVKLRVLTGILAGQEGYIVRILRDRRLVMDFGGNAIAISNVHNEDFEIAE